MDVSSYPCPECATTLRIKNRAYIDRNFPCPECETLLVVSYNLQQELEIRQVALPQSRKAGNATGHQQTFLATCLVLLANFTRPVSQTLRKLAASPVAIAWLAASLCAAAVCLSAWMKSSPTRPVLIQQTQIEQPNQTSQPVANHVDNPSQQKKETPQNLPPQQANLPPEAPQIDEPPAPVVALIPLPAPVVARKPAGNVPVVTTSQIEVAPVNIEELLAQKLVKYSQNKPLPVRDFLEQFAELSGLKVQVDETVTALENDPLSQSVTFELDNATLKQLLTHVLKKVGLMFKADKASIRILQQK